MAFKCPSFSDTYGVYVSGELINILAAQGATRSVYLRSETPRYKGQLASPVYFLAPLPDGNWWEVAAVGLDDSVQDWGAGRVWGNDRLADYSRGRDALLSDPGALVGGVLYSVTDYPW